jgi:hypothetical protein
VPDPCPDLVRPNTCRHAAVLGGDCKSTDTAAEQVCDGEWLTRAAQVDNAVQVVRSLQVSSMRAGAGTISGHLIVSVAKLCAASHKRCYTWRQRERCRTCLAVTTTPCIHQSHPGKAFQVPARRFPRGDPEPEGATQLATQVIVRACSQPHSFSGPRSVLQAWDAILHKLMTAPVQRAGPDTSFNCSQQALLMLLVQPFYAIESPAMVHAQAALLWRKHRVARDVQVSVVQNMDTCPSRKPLCCTPDRRHPGPAECFTKQPHVPEKRFSVSPRLIGDP